MKRIKVTGYIDPDDMLDVDLDLSHPMGVADNFYNDVSTGARDMPTLAEIEFELVDE